ncbi:MAG TPA: SRPBCC family protein [Rugosimonospora sp.]|nr:SRPBCC family protein [Rugosimonospora sp.]
MAKVSKSADMGAAPGQVWQVAVDLPRYADWFVPHEGFAGEVPATLGEGTSYRQRVKLMGQSAEVTWRVATATAPSRLEAAGSAPMGVKAQSRILIEPAGAGSRITLEMEFSGAVLVGPMGRAVESQVGTALEESLDKLNALLDGATKS